VNKLLKKKTESVLNLLFFFLILYFIQIYEKSSPFKSIAVKKNLTKIRVRYGETDQMGVVYYGNYAQYLEQGRTEWLRDLGFSYKWMEANNVHLPVINLTIDYKAPAHYDDVLLVTTALKKIPTFKIDFYYEIHNEEGVLLITATTSLVFVNSTTKKIQKAPDYLLKKLQE